MLINTGKDWLVSVELYFGLTNITWCLDRAILTNYRLVLLILVKDNHCTESHIFFFQMSWKDGLSKKIALEHDLSCIIWKDGIFFPKTWSFFPGQKVKDGLSREIHGNMMHRPAKKATGNLIYRVEVWPLLKFIRLEIFHNE